jgi:hypothetical protein
MLRNSYILHVSQHCYGSGSDGEVRSADINNFRLHLTDIVSEGANSVTLAQDHV